MFYFPVALGCLLVLLLVATGCFFFDNKKKYLLLTLLLGLLISSIWIIRVIALPSVNLADGCRYIAYSFTIALFLLFCFAVLQLSKWTKPLIYIAFTIILVPLGIYWAYFLSQGTCLNVDALIALWQTNFKEAFEYAVEYAAWQHIFMFPILFLLYYAIVHLTDNKLKINRQCILLLAIFLLVNCFACRSTCNNSITLVFANAGQNITEYNAFKKTQEERRINIAESPILKGLHCSEEPSVYLLVIGESHNRDYMSAYGYSKKNTPWLDEMKGRGGFLLFENAYACHTQTVPALSYALTAKNQYNDIKLSDAVSILEIANAAGFDTVWLSNQVKYSAWDTPVSVIASAAKKQKWLNNASGNATLTASYDGALLNAFDDLEIKGKTLIVVHLMGSHINYDSRYPREFNKFGTKTDEDAYSNSLLYNDYVMEQLFSRAKKLPNFKAMIYFSDHASVPKHKLDHDSTRFVSSMTHIPTYICFAEDYAVSKSDKFRELEKHTSACFTNDLIFNLLLAVMDIRLPQIYEPNNDLTSPSYDTDRNRFRTSNGERKIGK